MKYTLLLLSFAAAALVQCASYRQVSVRPGEGGVMAYKGGLLQAEEAKSNMQAAMARNCGDKKVKIVEEGEVVVGSETQINANSRTNSQTNAQGVRVGTYATGQSNTQSRTSLSGSAQTRDVTEWRTVYACE